METDINWRIKGVKDYIRGIDENAERRFNSPNIEARAEGEKNIVEGLGIVYNKLSEDLGGFREIIEPGAARGLLDNPEIMILFNHNPNLVLARNTETATLTESDAGVTYRYNSPDTTIAKDLLENLRLKNIRKSSFSFLVKEDRAEKRTIDGEKVLVRVISQFKEFFDFAPVTYPGYKDTSAYKRCLDKTQAMEDIKKSLSSQRKIMIGFTKRTHNKHFNF